MTVSKGAAGLVSEATQPWTGRVPGIDHRGLRFHVSWTRGFIRDFGWGEYLRVVWRDTTIYRLKNWRCWFGHELGEVQWDYADVEYMHGLDGWRYCERPNCEFCERDA